MTTLNVTEPGDMLALGRHALGYLPEQSLVLIGLKGESSKTHLRADLSEVMVGHDAGTQLAAWLMADKDQCPEAVVVVVLDQEGQYSAEELGNLLLHVNVCFALYDVPVVEYSFVGDRWKQPLHEALSRHPRLAIEAVDPRDEVVSWVSRRAEPLVTERGDLDHLQETASCLLLQAAEPDWAAISALDETLDKELPRAEGPARDLVIELKALVFHAKGQNSLVAVLLEHIQVERLPINRFTRGVHRFALHQKTSYQQWERGQNDCDD